MYRNIALPRLHVNAASNELITINQSNNVRHRDSTVVKSLSETNMSYHSRLVANYLHARDT